VKAGTIQRRRINATASFNDTAVVTATTQEEQTRTQGEDYESLERLIDSITRDFSRKGINSRLKALVKNGSSRNATTICDHILAEQTNTTSRHQLQRVKSRVCSGFQSS
jgi:hypothetical protein